MRKLHGPLTPGGYRLRQHVHLIEAENHISIREGRVLKVSTATGEPICDLGAAKKDEIPYEPHLPRHVSLLKDPSKGAAPAISTVLGQGWVAYAGWLNDTGHPITSFTAKWTVPPPPGVDNGQTVFLFIGIQNTNFILQPVLQWGESFAGGGPFWTITNWYVNGLTGPTACKALVRVQPGDVLEANIRLKLTASGVLSYVSSFMGHPSIDLEREGIPELTWANVALESYKVGTPSDYPDTTKTVMSALNMTTGDNPVTPDWRLHPRVLKPQNPHSVLDPDGDIELFYTT